MFVHRAWNVSVSVTVTVPSLVVETSLVEVLTVVSDETVPIVLVPVRTVVSPNEDVVELVEKLVTRGEVKVVVLVPAVSPVVVVVVVRVLVFVGG